MSDWQYRIAQEIFERFPGYVRGVVVCHDVANGDAPPALVELLREAEASVRARLTSEGVAEAPAIRAWREAYRAFGAKPSEFRSSIEALARRALRGDALPSINALVDIGNVISLRSLLPAGGHAIDLLRGDIELRLAHGGETFIAFGSDREERPPAGEVIFAEGDTVLTRRWTWRQAKHTLTLPTTRAIEFNVDGLPPADPDAVRAACDELAALVARFCGGTQRVAMLSATQPGTGLGP